MAPEYGATMGFFPIDAQTLQYLEQTARGDSLGLIKHYACVQGLWHDPSEPQPSYDEVIEVDLSEIAPCIAGPRRPQAHIPLSEAAIRFDEDVYQKAQAIPKDGVPVGKRDWALDNGHVVIAAFTSCTNTSNPSNMLVAGLLAINAVRRGLTSKPRVKRSEEHTYEIQYILRNCDAVF